MPLKLKDDGEPLLPGPRFIDIEFTPDYKLHRTHKQRIATEFRVPLFEGFTMPPRTRDSETAAMYKSLLLRALSVEEGDEPEDVRFAKAFEPLCVIEGNPISCLDGNQAFSKAWLAHMDEQKLCALEASKRFLDRYEYMSLWETQEVHDELNEMLEAAQESSMNEMDVSGGEMGESPDPDKGNLGQL